MSKSKSKRQRKPLGISCKTAKCTEGLHCFLDAPRGKGRSASAQKSANNHVTSSIDETQKIRRCWSCGADLVDWKRVHNNDILDSAYTFQCLRLEVIRHEFWHRKIDQKAINYAQRKGLIGLRIATEKRLRKYVGKGVQPGEPTFDGRQTPFKDNPIFYAQHATSTCCRKCMEVWHGIPYTQDLNDHEIHYFTDLIMLYIQERMPNLRDNGITVPPIRKTSKSHTS